MEYYQEKTKKMLAEAYRPQLTKAIMQQHREQTLETLDQLEEWVCEKRDPSFDMLSHDEDRVETQMLPQ